MTLVNYTEIPVEDNDEPLVDLAGYDFVLEPRYFQQGFSNDEKMYARQGVAEKLVAIQKRLTPNRLKLWDVYRSREVQQNIYQDYWSRLTAENPEWDEQKLRLETGKFVSPTNVPGRIPPHATGGAIDVTLVDKEGAELPMGTDHDFFGSEAGPFHFEIYRTNEAVRKNRELLRNAMLAEGFTLDGDEWWHFDYGNQIWALKSGRSAAMYGEALLDSK